MTGCASRWWMATVCLGLSALTTGCQTVARGHSGAPSFTRVSEPGSAVARLEARSLTGVEAKASTLHPLVDAHEALAARLLLIGRAERAIDLQYYIFRPDSSGRSVAEALVSAANRGVRVRLLLDDWGARPDDLELQALASVPGMEVRLFNPLAHPHAPLLSMLLDFERGNRRMHNKMLLADGRAAIVGGRNIGDEYFERRREFTFADIDVLAFGPVVRDMSAGFDAYWNDALTAAVASGSTPAATTVQTHTPNTGSSAASAVDNVEARLRSGALRRFAGRATAVQDLPGKLDPQRPEQRSNLGHDIARLVGEVRRELLIVSPYFVPGEGGVEQLRALTGRGVRVSVVTNSLAATDVPAVHAGYARYRKALLRAGVALYELRADAGARTTAQPRSGSSRVSLHAKVMVVDRRTAFVGSMNIDPRSLRLNTENGVVMESPEMADELVRGIERDLANDAWQVTLDGASLRWRGRAGEADWNHDPDAGLWLRLRTRLLSWMPIEEIL